MKYELNQNTFFVTEILKPNLVERGNYYYYLLEKRGLSERSVVKRIGKKFFSSGLKDKNATTRQWVCFKEKIKEINNEDFSLKFVGESSERIFVGKHKGNQFRVIVELGEGEEKKLKGFDSKRVWVANYFGEQRFTAKNVGVVELINKGDFGSALKTFLIEETKFDSDLSKRMKSVIKSNWGEWSKIIESELIRESRKRKQFEYLLANPTDFLGAFSASEPKSVSILLKTAQAMRFNQELSELIREKIETKNFQTLIAGQILFLSANKSIKREITINPNEFEKKFRKRILTRSTFFQPKKFRAKKIENNLFELSFELKKGEYATVFLNYLSEWLKNN